MTHDNQIMLGDIICIPGYEGRYVAERAEVEGGGIGHHPGDRYPSANHVTARLLDAGNQYNPNNKTVIFYQGGEFDPATTLSIKNVKIIGHMTRTFITPVIQDGSDAPASDTSGNDSTSVDVPASEPVTGDEIAEDEKQNREELSDEQSTGSIPESEPIEGVDMSIRRANLKHFEKQALEKAAPFNQAFSLLDEFTVDSSATG